MPLGDFGLGRLPDFDDVHVEGQVHAGERVVGIERDLVAFDGGDHHDGRAGTGIGLETVADTHLALHGNGIAADFPDERGVVFAVSFGGGHDDARLRARLPVTERFLQPVNDLSGAFQINDRRSAEGEIETSL